MVVPMDSSSPQLSAFKMWIQTNGRKEFGNHCYLDLCFLETVLRFGLILDVPRPCDQGAGRIVYMGYMSFFHFH
jgi:hypothetical protein